MGTPQVLHLLLVVGAFVVLALGAWRSAAPDFNRILAIGLALFVLSFLL